MTNITIKIHSWVAKSSKPYCQKWKQSKFWRLHPHFNFNLKVTSAPAPKSIISQPWFIQDIQWGAGKEKKKLLDFPCTALWSIWFHAKVWILKALYWNAQVGRMHTGSYLDIWELISCEHKHMCVYYATQKMHILQHPIKWGNKTKW